MQSTRRGSFSVHRLEKNPGSKYSSTSGLAPRGHLVRQAEFHASSQDEASLSCLQSAGTLRSESEIRGTLRFLPQPEKDLERPSSTRLEARFPYCREPAYCILSAYCILHIECSTFHSIIFQDLE